MWISTLDNRFTLEVVRTEKKNGYIADLRLFDHHKDDLLIYNEEVWLNYGAIWGVDIDNTTQWYDKIIQFIDNEYDRIV